MGGLDNIFKWEFNGIIIGNESVLNLVHTEAQSGGNYTCTVSNFAGIDSAFTTLYVAPYVVTSLDEQVLATNGSTLTILCDSAGFPTPIVHWIDMLNNVVSNSTLLEFNPAMFGDEGLYTCVSSADINGVVYTARNQTTVVGNNLLISFACHSIVVPLFKGTPEISTPIKKNALGPSYIERCIE